MNGRSPPKVQVDSAQDGEGSRHGTAKKARRMSLVRATFGGFVIAAVFVLSVVLISPNDAITSTTLRPPSGAAVQSDPITTGQVAPVIPERKAESNVESTDVKHHMVFSTGCTTFQDWQSYIFFFHALKAGQPGDVTRIASGCTPEEAEELKKLHKERIEIMSDRFHLHLTPDYMGVKPGFRYKFFNKPYGMRHWMEHGLGYPNSTAHDDDIVILLDPDQMLLRPLTNDFTNSKVQWKRTSANKEPKLRVEHGSPFGELYGYAAQWKTKVNVTHVTGEPNSPIEEVTMNEARDYYPLGPPYMATARDMYSIVVKWTEFVPRVHDNYPHLLAEMFAYSLAAAHVRLPHQTALSFMVSDTTNTAEGWSFIDPVPAAEVCYNTPREDLPQVLHYCHRYLSGKWFIGKYRLRKDFISCEAPMLMEPPSDIAVKYDYYIAPKETERTKHRNAKISQREAFMVCTMIKGLNEAAEYFKKHNCEEGTANFEKSYIFHDSIED